MRIDKEAMERRIRFKLENKARGRKKKLEKEEKNLTTLNWLNDVHIWHGCSLKKIKIKILQKATENRKWLSWNKKKISKKSILI